MFRLSTLILTLTVTLIVPQQNNIYFQATRPEMKQFLPSKYQCVLEIGCGEGNFRSNLDLSHEYWGVEQDVRAASEAEKKLDTVLVGDYHQLQSELPDNYFDLIICNDVIEHMEHHVSFMLNIKKKLALGGSLIISIPNVRLLSNLNQILFARDWHYREAGILDQTHLRFFTKKSLTRLLKQTDWQIDMLKGVNRYGGRDGGPRLILSYLAQMIYGFDCAYWQFAARVSISEKS
jgi:2-polyprenyl-3-methyl-5-hydroxy-6-metoxy-1,4-benzoquinol methylase